ncbi:MAG: C40 family peptidase [Lachnospiraceae bacterium]|nr:C40 family peptidase [Lachnospiraceae bacterium]
MQFFNRFKRISISKKQAVRVLVAGVLVTSLVTSSNVALAEKSVSQMTQEKNQLQSEINSLDKELVGVLTEINELESDVAQKNADIADAEDDIKEAQKAANEKYEEMKVRMKYMYEKGDNDIITIFLESGSLTDFINRVEYANTVYEYDRTQLEEYQVMIKQIESLKAGLEQEKVSLQAQQNRLSAQKQSLNSMIATKRTQVADFDSKLAKARELAARQAAAAQAAQATTTQKSNVSNVSGSTGGDKNPTPVSGGSGSSVVSYASQFIGNPYKWGGTSLTDGCDCSGFVYRVYQHFGVDYGRLTSDGFLGVGQEVSFNNIQAGDVVVYSGHVAIYDGNGGIVEAQSSRAGITNNRSVSCKPILGIRRLL